MDAFRARFVYASVTVVWYLRWFNYLFASVDTLTEIATAAHWRIVDRTAKGPLYMVTLSLA